MHDELTTAEKWEMVDVIIGVIKNRGTCINEFEEYIINNFNK